jgi:hypothetical protein
LVIALSFLEKVLVTLKILIYSLVLRSSITLGACENVPLLLNWIFLLVWDLVGIVLIILNYFGTWSLLALQNY